MIIEKPVVSIRTVGVETPATGIPEAVEGWETLVEPVAIGVGVVVALGVADGVETRAGRSLSP